MPHYSRYVGIGQESVGYAVAAEPTVRLDIASESLELRVDQRFIQPSGVISANRSYSTRRYVQGTIDAYFGFEKLSSVLRWLVGSAATLSAAAGAYDHQFAPSVQAEVPSLTIEVPREQALHRFVGCVITGARLSISGPSHWGLSLSIIGCDEELGSIPDVPESDFEAPIVTTAEDITYTVLVDNGSIAWYASLNALDLELAWTRRLRFSAGVVTPTGIIQHGSVKGRGRLRWFYGPDTAFLYDDYKAEADVAITAAWHGPEIGSTGELLTVSFQMKRARLVGRTPTIRGAGRGNIEHELPFELLDDGAADSPFRLEIINTDPMGYLPEPPAGAFFELPFLDGAGTSVADISGNGRTATNRLIGGGGPYGTWSPAGLTFVNGNGENGGCLQLHASVTHGANWTFCLAANVGVPFPFRGATNFGHTPLLSSISPGLNRHLCIRNDGKLVIISETAPEPVRAESTSSAYGNSPQFIAASLAADRSYAFYLGGAADGSGTTLIDGGVSASSDSCLIAGRLVSAGVTRNQCGDAILFYMMLWQRVLSPAEVLQAYLFMQAELAGRGVSI